MKVSTILDKIDSGAIALPEFQRGYVWGRRQVRDLVESLYRRFPVGSLLLWETATEGADARGDGQLQRGFVQLLLDGQQRITSLYGLARGAPPSFFDGDPRAFSDLRFHVDREEFGFYAPVTMATNPLWLDVGALLQHGPHKAIEPLLPALTEHGGLDERFSVFHDRINRLYQILDRDLHVEEITGEDKTLDVVVDLFNRVNTGGTKLSKGDLALAKLCAAWPEARDELKVRLTKWRAAGFHFSLDWLLRNVNAVITGRAEFAELANVEPARFREGLAETERAIDTALNLASTRLGLDHDRVLGGVGAFPVMSRFLAERGSRLADQRTADRMLYWYVNALLWGRYAGSTETVLNVDLRAIGAAYGLTGPAASSEDPLDRLIHELRRSRGDLRVAAQDFFGWSRGARFYPLLYMLSRAERARDLGSGLELRHHLLGQHAALEVHHVFPKALLYQHGYTRPDVNALANFTFLTSETNRSLGDTPPTSYLPACESRHPGVIASHWLPEDPDLWTPDRYPEFLARRRELLAQAANRLLDSLLAGDAGGAEQPDILTSGPVEVISDGDEAALIAEVQAWLAERGLAAGIEDFALLGLDGDHEDAVLDLAWPEGLEHGGERVALLLDEPPDVRDAASRHGYRSFTNADALRAHVDREVLGPAV